MTFSIDWGRFNGRTTFITGDEKNSGKTTFLKHAISELRGRGFSLAYMSAGVDGEAFDLISGAPKPVITAEVGDILVTSESALEDSEASFEVMRVFPGETVLGRPVLVRATEPGLVELIGPGTNLGLGEVLASLGGLAGTDVVLVDGAVDRVTQVGSWGEAGYVLALRVTQSALERSARRVRLAVLLDRLPVVIDGAGAPGCLEIVGALTAGEAAGLPDGCSGIIVQDFTRVFLDYLEMKRLCRDRPLYFRIRYPLVSVVVVLEGVGSGEFLEALGAEADGMPIYFAPYDPESGQVN